MKTWVFNEEMLRQALGHWINDSCGAASESEDYVNVHGLVMDFLQSDEATKLRVAQLDPWPTAVLRAIDADPA